MWPQVSGVLEIVYVGTDLEGIISLDSCAKGL